MGAGGAFALRPHQCRTERGPVQVPRNGGFAMRYDTCRHGREGTCPYCLAEIPPHHFWEMVRWRNELRRKGKPKTVRNAS